jgi:predicted  nucleic acid-binding Zn-ribbon protein
MSRSGELAVSIVQAKNGLEDSTEEVADTEKALSSLKKQCAAKEKEYSAASKDRADEMAAISAAIGVLNDDDALDVFKKAVPAAMIQEGATAFLQKSSHKASRAIKAHAILASAAAKANSPQLNVMLMSLKSKIRLGSTSGAHKFEEIVKMIDDMVVLLGKQQDEDDKMKEWCRVELDKAEDEEAAAKTEVGRLEASIEEVTDSIATLGDEIKGLQKSIEELDYTVAEATVQRKEEHAQFQQTVQMQEAAIGLISKAKGKLEKFYKPALVQKPRAAPKVQEVSEDDDQAFSFVQVKAHSWSLDDAMDSDSTTTETHQKVKGGGVMALMDSIIHDTEMAMKDSEFGEKTAQDDYASVMGDAQTNRAADSKSMTDKAAAKADLESKLVTEKEGHAGATNGLLGAGKLIADLHGQCDFIIENYDLRKDSRASESDSLKNAKAVLSGASF